MKINTDVSLRYLATSLKLNPSTKYNPPIKNNGYIIDPHKFSKDIKDDSINVDEIKKLLLMMLRGDANFISELVKPNSSNYVNTMA